jgi:tetratricopeptide (TPR) repeat protein
VRALPVVIAVLLATGPTPASADQDDPRLDRLFAVLHASENAREVYVAQSLIWDIWLTHDDTELTRLMRRGVFAMAKEHNDEALRIFDRLIATDPGYAEAWNKRATLYFILGELDKSRADVARTLELEPRHFGALSGLGQIELLRGDRKKALQAFEHALDANPHLAGARMMVDRLRPRATGREL